jgi:hypothetical protein
MPVAPDYIKDAAKRALEARSRVAPSRRAGTPVGIARANQLARGDNLSLQTLIRMRSYLERAKPAYDDAREQGLSIEDSKAIMAYYLWGGPRALAWVNGQISRLQS